MYVVRGTRDVELRSLSSRVVQQFGIQVEILGSDNAEPEAISTPASNGPDKGQFFEELEPVDSVGIDPTSLVPLKRIFRRSENMMCFLQDNVTSLLITQGLTTIDLY